MSTFNLLTHCNLKMLNFLIPTMWHQIPHTELRHNFRCRKCPICALFSAGDDFWCRKTLFLAPNRPRHNFRCRKTLFLTPNCLPLLIPVQKMPNFDTESHTPQLPVQKMPNLCTKLGPEQLPVQKMPPKPSKTPRRNVFPRPPGSAGRSGSCGK